MTVSELMTKLSRQYPDVEVIIAAHITIGSKPIYTYHSIDFTVSSCVANMIILQPVDYKFVTPEAQK